MDPMSFTLACRNFFGQQPDQSLREFGAEINRLSFEDRCDLAIGLAHHFKRPIEIKVGDQTKIIDP